MGEFWFNSEDGVRQFDSNDWPCMCPISRVVVPSSALDYDSELPVQFAKSIDITVNGTCPLMALKIPGAMNQTTGNPRKAGGIVKVTRSGSSWTFRVRIFSFIEEWGFTYYIIDRMPVHNLNGGLTLWSPTGGVVFSSEIPYAKIASSVQPGRTYAAVAYASSITRDEYIDDFNNPYVIYSVDGTGVYDIGNGPVSGTLTIDGGTYAGNSAPTYPGSGYDRNSGFSFDMIMIDVTDIDGGSVDDYSLNSIDWPNATGTSTGADVTVTSVQRSMAGINRDISLTITATLSGNLSTANLHLFSTTRGGLKVISASETYNIAVSPGEVLYFAGYGTTSSGMRTGQWAITVVNASNGDATVDTLTIDMTVDSDNNYNVPDPNPDAVDWANISDSTNDSSRSSENSYAFINGINQTITIRATISGYTSNAASTGFYLYINGELGGGVTGLANGAYVEHEANNGDGIKFRLDSATTSGTRSTSFTVTVTNVTTGAVLDTFTVAQTVDADNNFNVVDYTPDAISVSNLTGVTNAELLNTTTSSFQVTGINQAITLRFTRDSLVTTGSGLNLRRLYVYKSTTGSTGPWTQYSLGTAAGAFLDISVNNGDWIYVQGYVDTTSGKATATWQNYIDYHIGGSILGRLASFQVSGTVDNDNNFNIPDYTPDAMDWGSGHFSTTSDTISQGNNYLTFNGINRSITVRLEYGRDGNLSSSYMHMYVNGSYRGGINTASGNYSTTINPGDQIAFVGGATTTSGTRAGTLYTNVWNDTTGVMLDSFYYGFTVDSDNNYNVADVHIDGFNLADNGTPIYQGGGAAVTQGTPATISGINTTVNLYFEVINIAKHANVRAEIYFYKNGAGMAGLTSPRGNNSPLSNSFSVANGDQLRIDLAAISEVSGGGAAMDAYVTVKIYNTSDGNTLVDTVNLYTYGPH